MSAFVSSPAFLPPPPATLRCPPQATATPPSVPTTPPRVQAVADRLWNELPTLFDSAAKPDYSIYAESVTFEDPLNKFRGVSRYAANINFLNSSPVFATASLSLYDVRVISPYRDTVRTRWALQMVANLPWRPCAAFTGQSDYVVNDAGKVCRHIDYWDSLPDSAFFSLSAVVDLLAQCRPGRISPLELGGFQLLRRTPVMEVRNFEMDAHEGVLLRQTRERDGVQEWCVVQNASDAASSCVVKLAAVKTLSSQPSAASFQSAKLELRDELERVDYATSGEKSFCVKSTVQGLIVFEAWVELECASANVNE